MAKSKSDSDAENNSNDKFVNAEAEKFLLLFDKTFTEFHEKKLDSKNNADIDSEEGLV